MTSPAPNISVAAVRSHPRQKFHMDAITSFARALRSRLAALIPGRRDPHRARVERLRRRGVRIGERCVIHTDHFSTEPYLVEIGNHVGIASGTHFLTHDGSIWLTRDSRPDVQHFGKITVGDNTYIGMNCIIGAGSVVRGNIPDNSIVVGNPASIVGRASLLMQRLQDSPDTFDSLRMDYTERMKTLCRHFAIDI